MKKRIACLALSAALAVGLFSGCSSSSGSSSAASSQSPSNKNVTVHIFMGSPELTDAMNAAIKEYKTVRPNVTIQLQVLQSDLNTVLKSKIASGNVPDVFQTTDGPELKSYAEYSADLTDTAAVKTLQPVVKNSMEYGGKVLGLPLKVDDWGIIYNKSLFSQAGITSIPKTMSDLQKDCELLKAKNITAFADGYKEWWTHKYVLQHFMAVASPDVAQLTEEFNTGKTTFAQHPILYNYFKFTDLTLKYGISKPLDNDENGEISDIAGGKVAMCTGLGTWAETNIRQVNPNIDIGMMPYPVSDDPSQANYVASAGQCLRVSDSSQVKGDAIAFFNWLFTSDYGKNSWFPNVAKVVSPSANAKSPAGCTLPTDFNNNAKNDNIKIYDSSADHADDSFNQLMGEVMQAYIAGTKTQSQCITQIEQDWKQYGDPNQD